jgi:hypothetical protein
LAFFRRCSNTRFRLAQIVADDGEAEEVLRRLVRIGRQAAPQADRRQCLRPLLGGQRHFGGAAGQARIAGLLRQRQHRDIRTLPLALLEFQFGLGDTEQQVAGQLVVGQGFRRRRVGGRRHSGRGAVRRGRRGRRRRGGGPGLFLRGDSARRQQGREGYNGESVFQEKVLAGKGTVRFYAQRVVRVF